MDAVRVCVRNLKSGSDVWQLQVLPFTSQAMMPQAWHPNQRVGQAPPVLSLSLPPVFSVLHSVFSCLQSPCF